jgi:hypothetical protein
MKYADVQEHVSKLREMADFLEAHGHKMPGDVWISHYEYVNLTATTYDDGEAKIDEAGTKENIRKFLDAVGDCEKDYSDDQIVIIKKYSDGSVMFKGEVDRNIMCKRVVVGQKVIPAREAQTVDEVEWVCADNVSLLRYVNS